MGLGSKLLQLKNDNVTPFEGDLMAMPKPIGRPAYSNWGIKIAVTGRRITCRKFEELGTLLNLYNKPFLLVSCFWPQEAKSTKTKLIERNVKQAVGTEMD